MLTPNLDQKAVAHGSRLLPDLIVRPHRGLVEGSPYFSNAPKVGRPSLILRSGDSGPRSVDWERRWLAEYGALVAATPKDNSRRAWSKADRCWASGKRQIIEGVINQLKDQFFLERHRTKTLGGLLARLAAKIAAYTCGQYLNDGLGRPLRHLADLLV